MRILGISGRRQAGKDTLARQIEKTLAIMRRRVRVVSTADWPKGILRAAGVPDFSLYGSDEEKSSPMPCGRSGRDLTRDLYNLLAAVNPAALIERVLDDAKYSGADFILLPCVRNVVDVQTIQSRGGPVVRLLRCPFPDDTAPEETALDGYTGFDHVVPDCGPGDAFISTVRFLHDKGWLNAD